MPHMTKHAEARFAQRGIRRFAVALMMRFGSETADGFIMTTRDTDEAIGGLRNLIKYLEQLRGVRIVMEGDTVVTVYYPVRKEEKRLLRHRRK